MKADIDVAGGYPRLLGQRLPAYLGAAAGPGATPPRGYCTPNGARSLLGGLQRPNRQTQSR